MTRDHGGNLAEAVARYGGPAEAWLDLSTGINPVAWPVPELGAALWSRLPDRDLTARFCDAARRVWDVPERAAIVPAAGASPLIRQAPRLGLLPASVAIPGPTYNEHAAAFAAEGWEVTGRPGPRTAAMAVVSPNNPDGRRWTAEELLLLAEAVPLLIVDESFGEIEPSASLAPQAGREGLVVLKSFGKFWGLAGLRLGCAITGPRTAARLADMLGPWPVSGPALEIGARALGDTGWAEETRARLRRDAARLEAMGRDAGWRVVGGAGLFVTFETGNGAAVQAGLARHCIWSRVFPYAPGWVRLGLPGPESWDRLTAALEEPCWRSP